MIKIALVMSANIKSIYCEWHDIDEEDFTEEHSEECLETILAIYDGAIESIDESHEVENEDGDVESLTGKIYGVKRGSNELFMVRNAKELFAGSGYTHQELFMADEESRPDWLPVMIFESNMLDSDSALGEWFLPVSETISYFEEPEYLTNQHLLAFSSVCDDIAVQSYEGGEMSEGITSDGDCETYSGEQVLNWYGIKAELLK